jgi:hypothetical protein
MFFRAGIVIAAMAVLLSGCSHSSGEAAAGFSQPSIAAAYIALDRSSFFGEDHAAAMVIQPHIAVTNAHNANLVPQAEVIGVSQNDDLMFFRTDRTRPLAAGVPYGGERVILYGQGKYGDLRTADGTVSLLKPYAFTVLADAGEGFSGGPVLDAANGQLLGITHGYVDGAGPNGDRRAMAAYSMSEVALELVKAKALPVPK